MADYRKRSENFGVPIPGKPVIIKEKVVEVESNRDNDIDINALADLIAEKVSSQSGIINPTTRNPNFAGNLTIDNDSKKDFDETSSMSQLADSMVVQRGNKSSNFDDLGGVKKTKKDESQTINTIDLLSGLDD
jgi:hypothetical protein